MLTDQIGSQIRIYKQFMTQGQDEDLIRVFERERQPSMLGSKESISWVKERFLKRKSIRKFQHQRCLHPIWIESYLK